MMWLYMILGVFLCVGLPFPMLAFGAWLFIGPGEIRQVIPLHRLSPHAPSVELFL